MIMDEQDYICHHGVKGMKWGFRKLRPESANVKKAPKSRASKNLKGAGPKVNKVSKKTKRRGRNIVQQAWHNMWKRDPAMDKVNATIRARMLDHAISGALVYGAALGETKNTRIASAIGLGAYDAEKIAKGIIDNRKKRASRKRS